MTKRGHAMSAGPHRRMKRLTKQRSG
jgi:hypothetical protein